MADIHIFVTGNGVGPNNTARVTGEAVVEGGENRLDWSVDVPLGALAATANAAIKEAAIAAAAAIDITVGALDKKSLWGGVVGL